MLPAAAASRMTCLAVVTLLFGTVAAKGSSANKTAGLVKTTVSCATNFPGDTKVEACSAFCDVSQARTHCLRCKCKACPFCTESKGQATATSMQSPARTSPPSGASKVHHKHHSHNSSSSNSMTTGMGKSGSSIMSKGSSSGSSKDSSSTSSQHSSSGGSKGTSSSSKGTSSSKTDSSGIRAGSGGSSSKAAPTAKASFHHHTHKSPSSSSSSSSSSSPSTSATPSSRTATEVSSTSSATPRFDYYCAKASCDRWCNSAFAHHHCNDCKCKACAFCSSYKCEAPTCDKWCDSAFKKFHCTKCKCRKCNFCASPSKAASKSPPPPPPPPLALSPSPCPPGPAPHPPPPPPPLSAPQNAPACTATLPDDEPFELCTPVFCRYRTRSADCAFCKCKACSFCQAAPPPAPQPSVSPAISSVPFSATSSDAHADAGRPPPPSAQPSRRSRTHSGSSFPTASTVEAQPAGTSVHQPNSKGGDTNNDAPAAPLARAGVAALAIPPGVERLRATFDATYYAPLRGAAAAEAYAAELTSVLDVPSHLMVLRKARDDGAAVVFDLLPEHGTTDLGQLSPSAQVARLKQLVMSTARATSSRAVRATVDLWRLDVPQIGDAAPIATASEVTAARMVGRAPLAVAVGIATFGAIFGAVMAGKLIASGVRAARGYTAPTAAKAAVAVDDDE